MAEREIVLDTETTGLDPFSGDRLVEIGCVELFNLMPTGNTFHHYLDPERDVPEEAFRVHGLSREFLTGKPKFADIADTFRDFLGDAKIIIHNAEFDMRFINAEFGLLGQQPIPMTNVIDTLALARRKHPGSPNSLDALCSRYKIDSSRRTKHGALLDSELLAEVYAELMGGRQTTLTLSAAEPKKTVLDASGLISERAEPLSVRRDPHEVVEHQELVSGIGSKAVWHKYGYRAQAE